MSVLASELRRALEEACVLGRRASESACGAALESLGVGAGRPPSHLNDGDRVLRRGLRVKSRQLGDTSGSVKLLVAECAYEQWHRLLFSRFLAENALLIHPGFKAPVTLAECEELAPELGEPDGWSVAARFAAEILPGIFRLDDPCVRLRLAPEGRLELERIVANLSTEVFVADDALGWVYQYWQRDKKDEVNASERKIGGADLGPVTQLFTENYMVRFLLENSLGAWWAIRHPDSPLVKEWEYLRFDDDGQPAGGDFEQWPDRVAEVTAMDPCCGSGHFLVEAFSMLWQMRAEEEGLSVVAAQDAVLRDNLFGLELDPRCVQIAMFAVALQAWKAGGGWRELPLPNIACSGIPVRAPVEEWKQLANGDERLENALVRLHILFRDGDTLGSLIDPKRAVEITDATGRQSSFEDVDWDHITPFLTQALRRESDDPASAVLGADAAGIARAADYLSRHYTLTATNPPYLSIGRFDGLLRQHLDSQYPAASQDLFAGLVSRWLDQCATYGFVCPQSWQHQDSFKSFRKELLTRRSVNLVARIGNDVWQRSGNPYKLHTSLCCIDSRRPSNKATIHCIDVGETPLPNRIGALGTADLLEVAQACQLENVDSRIIFVAASQADLPLLSKYAKAHQGMATGDGSRFVRYFWEVELGRQWEPFQSSVTSAVSHGGRECVVLWEAGRGELSRSAAARVQGANAWGNDGVAVSQMGRLHPTLYRGDIFDMNVAAIIPDSSSDLEAIWTFVNDSSYVDEVRRIDQNVKVTNANLVKIPFDRERWQRVADKRLGDGLPEPWSDDPVQWLFEGRPEVATEPLQAAIGRLLGYRWPEQPETDDLHELADVDGIVCLPSVLGETAADDRLREVLARAFAVTWSPTKTSELLSTSGSKKKDLESWLRDDFFKTHCKLFKNRPFIWHVWDGRRDGFGALVNYHRLDRATLERLTFTYLGDWIERQKAGVRDDAPGAEERLGAAQDLQRRLRLILEGEPPYDVYVRWKSLAEQPLGWDPDLNDGVRLNVRPFVKAGVLRAKFNVKWTKDRGKNPDGSERHNDLHYTQAEKKASRIGTQQ